MEKYFVQYLFCAVILAVVAIFQFFRIRKFRKQYETQKKLHEFYEALYKDNFWFAINICNSYPSIINDCVWDIQKCVQRWLVNSLCSASQDNIVNGDFGRNLEMDILGFKNNPLEVLRTVLMSALAGGFTIYAKESEENKEKIVRIYEFAVFWKMEEQAKLILVNLLVTGVIKTETAIVPAA